MFKHQGLQTTLSIFRSLAVLGRGGETQLQVRENLNKITVNKITFRVSVFLNEPLRMFTIQQTQSICITFMQRHPNVFDVGPTLYTFFCDTYVLCLLGIRHIDPNKDKQVARTKCAHYFYVNDPYDVVFSSILLASVVFIRPQPKFWRMPIVTRRVRPSVRPPVRPSVRPSVRLSATF